MIVALLLATLGHCPQELSAADVERVRQRLAEWLAAKTAPASLGDLEKLDVRALEAAVRRGPALAARTALDALTPSERKKSQSRALTDGFTFASGEDQYSYAVALPETYRPDRPFGLLLDLGHAAMVTPEERLEQGQVQFWLRARKNDDWIVARTNVLNELTDRQQYDSLSGADNRAGMDRICQAFDDCLRDLAGRFAVDPDRIVLLGLSQTGYWTWYLGAHSAWRFAALVPMSAVTHQVRGAFANLLPVPIWILQGGKDTVVDAGGARTAHAELAQLGARVELKLYPDAGHEAWMKFPEVFPQVSAVKRERYPKRFHHTIFSTQPRDAWWVRVRKIAEGQSKGKEKEGLPVAAIEGEITDAGIVLRSRQVQAIDLLLCDDLVRLDQPLKVQWNGKTVFDGPVKRDAATLVATAVERGDWRATYTVRLPLTAP
jgi:predicted esterase